MSINDYSALVTSDCFVRVSRVPKANHCNANFEEIAHPQWKRPLLA